MNYFDNASIESKSCCSIEWKNNKRIQDEFIPIKQGQQPHFKDKHDRVFVLQEEKEKERIWNELLDQSHVRRYFEN